VARRQDKNPDPAVKNRTRFQTRLLGIRCPKCGGVRWRTHTTLRLAGWVRRYRTCIACGRRITTG